MKTIQRTIGKCFLGSALVFALTTNLFAQINTNLQFTAVAVTDEQAIQLTWSSVSNEVYEIDEADQLNGNEDGTTAWNKLYDQYPSQGTNTFWLDTGNYNLVPQIVHPKNMPMRFYRIVDLGADTTSDEPNVSIVSPTNSVAVTGELTITVVASTDQPVLSGTKLYVDGQEMQMADSTTNWIDGSTNYEIDTYSINTCEWLNRVHVFFASAECESGYAVEPNSGPVTSGHGVSPFVSVLFSNLVEGISFSQPSFNPSSGQTQQVSAVFANNSDWTLNIVDVYSNFVQTASGSGTSMVYNWDGTSNGTNIPNGIYYYYISAQTNGESSDVVVGGSGGGGSPSTPALARVSSIRPEPSSLWAVAPDSENVVPFIIYPPGFDTNGFTIFKATPSEVKALTAAARPESAVAMDSGGSFSPNVSGGGSSAASQNSPAAPQRPPNNPVRGLAGTFGIAYDTYTANGTNSVNTPPLQNQPGLPGSYIQMESFPANSGLNWGPRPQHIAEATTFVGQMTHFGWSNSLNEADGQLSIGSLRGSGTPFNNVNMGVLILHGTYGNTQDYMAGLCKQMYFVVASGGSGQYLRFSEMNLGGSGTNGLKWMLIDACHSLYHVNWSSMKNMGIKPYNSNLHFILGADTDTYAYPRKWWNFATYMNYGRHNFYSPYTIRDAYYQGNTDAFKGVNFPAGTTITLAVAGDSACLDDSLQTNTPPSGSWKYSAIKMKRIIFILFQMLCFTAGFAQNPSWKANNEVISARPDLDVHWEATNKFPRKVWMYQLLPNNFSPEIISNVMMLCSFTGKDKIEDDTNGIAFQSIDHSRTLSISFSSGEIEYETREIRYSPTNLAVGVPQISQLPQMATNLLHKLHISFSDITGYFGTNRIEYLEPALTYFYVGENTLTNIPYRMILFKRSVDGLPIAYQNYRFNVGEHGKIFKISIVWPNLKRIKSYRAVSPKDVVNFLHSGNATRGPVPENVGDIDWPSIKSIAITKAIPSYLIDDSRLYPFLHLDALVDTGNVKVKVGMACPIFDETKL